MFRRLIKTCAVLAVTVATLGGCGSPLVQKSLYDRISETLTGLTSYEALATVRYYSNNSTNAYDTKQECLSTGEYRVEVLQPSEGAGNVTVFDGKTITQYNPLTGGKIAIGTTETPERSEIFLTSFIKNHLAGQEVTIAVSESSDDARYTTLDANIPGDNPYLSTERLVIDNETLKPTQLIIMDEKGKERITVTYSTINYNVPLDKSVFTIKTQA